MSQPCEGAGTDPGAGEGTALSSPGLQRSVSASGRHRDEFAERGEMSECTNESVAALKPSHCNKGIMFCFVLV